MLLQRQLQSRRHACYSDQLRTSRAASANLSSECQEPVLLKHESKSGIMYEAELMKQRRRAPRLGLRSAANEPSSEHQPALHKHESMSCILNRGRADEAVVASITLGTEISCA